MRGERYVLLAVLSIGLAASATHGQSKPDGNDQAQAPAWTAPGWYVLEHPGGDSRPAIRAGPFRDQPTCAAFRSSEFPKAPRGHPEMDNLDCRQLLSRPD